MRKQILKTVIKALDKMGYKDKEIDETTDLFNGLGLDSLDAVELTMTIEQEYNITIPDTEINNIKTVGDILDLTSKYIKD